MAMDPAPHTHMAMETLTHMCLWGPPPASHLTCARCCLPRGFTCKLSDFGLVRLLSEDGEEGLDGRSSAPRRVKGTTTHIVRTGGGGPGWLAVAGW